jgi:hypothetical protein
MTTYPISIRVNRFIIDEIEGCSLGRYEDASEEDEITCYEILQRHRGKIELKTKAEAEEVLWELDTGTTSLLTNVDRLMWVLREIIAGTYTPPTPKPSKPRAPKTPIGFCGDVDLRPIAKSIAKLLQKEMRFILPRQDEKGNPISLTKYLRRDPRNCKITWRRRNDDATSGHYKSNGRIVISVGTDLVDALHAIIHEFLHGIVGLDHDHNHLFRHAELKAHRIFNGSRNRKMRNLPMVKNPWWMNNTLEGPYRIRREAA